jgi:F-box protein 9
LLSLQVDHDVEKNYRKKLQAEYQQSLKDREDSIVKLSKSVKRLDIDDPDGLEVDEEDGEIEVIDPCWLLELLPNDLLLEIIAVLIHTDPHAHVNLSATCRRLADLSFSSTAYKHISNIVYPRQVYSSTSIQLNDISRNQSEMVKNWDFNWEKMLSDRPFLKYHGVYISKVSYISDGANAHSYYAPVKVVTYFRYMRFYPDGTLLKLTSTDEPAVIVPHFRKEDYKTWKNALVSRYVLEADGQVVIRTKTESYNFVEELNIVNLGYRKFHRLNWESSYIINKDGERGDFSLRKEKPFNFSGVKSFEVDYDLDE